MIAWYSSRDAAELLGTERLRPDAGFILDRRAGPVECWLEWDRGTETQERLEDKLRRYWNAEHRLGQHGSESRNILFVVPGHRPDRDAPPRLRQVQEAERERALWGAETRIAQASNHS